MFLKRNLLFSIRLIAFADLPTSVFAADSIFGTEKYFSCKFIQIQIKITESDSKNFAIFRVIVSKSKYLDDDNVDNYINQSIPINSADPEDYNKLIKNEVPKFKYNQRISLEERIQVINSNSAGFNYALLWYVKLLLSKGVTNIDKEDFQNDNQDYFRKYLKPYPIENIENGEFVVKELNETELKLFNDQIKSNRRWKKESVDAAKNNDLEKSNKIIVSNRILKEDRPYFDDQSVLQKEFLVFPNSNDSFSVYHVTPKQYQASFIRDSDEFMVDVSKRETPFSEVDFPSGYFMARWNFNNHSSAVRSLLDDGIVKQTIIRIANARSKTHQYDYLPSEEDVFQALTDGQLGDFEDYDGNIDDAMDEMGF